MRFQVCDVSKALGSVSKIVSRGNRVVFDSTGSYIENKQDGSRLWLRERAGVYVLDVWVRPYKSGTGGSGTSGAATKGGEGSNGGARAQGFARQDVPQ